MTASDMKAPLREGADDSSAPASPSEQSPGRDHYTVNCNLAEHRLLKPVQSDGPANRGRLYKCLAVVATVAVVVAVVGFAIGGTAGSNGPPATGQATTAQPAVQQNSDAAAAPAPAQASSLQDGGTGSSGDAYEPAGDQQSADASSPDPMAPADLNHIAAPLQSPPDAETQQPDCNAPDASQDELCREAQRRRQECAEAHYGRCAECSQEPDRFNWCVTPSDPARCTVVNGWPVPKAGYQPAAVPGGVEQCPPGAVKARAGTQRCIECTGRTFQRLPGQAACVPCPEDGTVSADHSRCTLPRKAMPGGGQVPAPEARHVNRRDASPSTDSNGGAVQPVVARPQLAHLPAVEADALASLDTHTPAPTAAARHYDKGGRRLR